MSRVPQTTSPVRKQSQTAALGIPTSGTFPPLLTSEDLATHFRKTVRTIRTLAARGKIRGAEKIGRDWRFHPAILREGINTSASRISHLASRIL